MDRIKLLLGLLLPALVTGWSPAQAQDDPANDELAPSPTATAPEPNTIPVTPAVTDKASTRSDAVQRVRNRVIEEIVVTAQKREENIQDVPQAVTAFSGGKLEALGVVEIHDLPNVTPGLTITRNGGADVVYLRGVGTDAFLPGIDPSVPYYQDGVPLLSGQGTSTVLDHVTRVEVLKGPQGTLFGASSVGGAINVVTADPTNELSGDVQAGYGNFNAQQLKGYANLPITETLATSISLFGNRQSSFVHNTVGPVIDEYSWGGRLKLRWDITDNLRNTFTGSYQRISDDLGLAWNNTRPAPVLAAYLPAAPATSFTISNNSVAGGPSGSTVIADSLNWQLPWIDLKATGSFQRQYDKIQADFDGTDRPVARFSTTNETIEQYTSELQFSSNSGTPFSDRLTWVGGFFYSYLAGGFDPLEIDLLPAALATTAGPLGQILTNLLDPITSKLAGINLDEGVALNNTGILKGTSLSSYFQGTVHITDSLGLILGARFQHVHRDLEGARTYVRVPTAPGGEITLFTAAPPTLHANQFSPRVGLQWYPFGEDAQLYASWARGYKSPSYNTVNLLGTALGPIKPVLAQKNNAYEIGIKTQLRDHTLQLNAAGFYTTQKDLLNGFIAVETGGVVAYNNVPRAQIKGAEGDVVWSPLPKIDPGLALTASAAYLDAKYTSFPNGQGFDETTGLAFGPGFPLPLGPQQDFSGNRIVRTPKLTYNASINQTLEVGNGTLELALDGSYNSGYYYLPQNSSLFQTSAYALFNTHATYNYVPWRVEVTLWCQNLTDELHVATEFVDDFGRTVEPNAPRTYGGRIKWSF